MSLKELYGVRRSHHLLKICCMVWVFGSWGGYIVILWLMYFCVLFFNFHEQWDNEPCIMLLLLLFFVCRGLFSSFPYYGMMAHALVALG